MPQPLSGEVACKILEPVFRKARKEKLAVEVLTEGVPYPLAHLLNRHERIDWSSYVRLMGNAGRVWSDEQFVAIGRAFFDNPYIRSLKVISRLLFTVRDLFRYGHRPSTGYGNQYMSCVVPKLEEHVGENRITIVLSVPEGYPHCREFLLVSKGLYMAVPRVLGMPAAKVELEVSETEATFQVVFSEHIGWAVKLRRALGWFFSARAVATELKDAHESLVIRYRELEQARTEIASKAEQLQLMNVQLEQKVAERTEQLEQSLQKLQILDRQKTEFFANASHELRTPLTLIVAPLESLASSPNLPDGARDELKGTLRSAYRLLKLVNDLLDLSKLEAGGMKLRMGPTDLVRLLEEVVRPWRPVLGQRKVSIDVEFPASLPMVGDAERLEQVALNLLSNAVKHTPDGGAIRVGASVAGDRVKFWIENTGEGVDPQDLPRLFERFAQSARSSARRFGTTGLGLPVVREFVELHGGTVSVRNVPGERVTFEVELPLGRPAEEGEAFDVPTPAGMEFRQYEVMGARESAPTRRAESSSDQPLLLIAEDNADLRSFLARALATEFRVAEAADGNEAFKLAHELVPDVILSDVMMPGMDGIELCRALKTDPQTAGLPVVLLTARGDLDQKVSAIEGGADDYLVKPFHIEEVKARLRSQVRIRRLVAQVSERERLASLGTLVAGVAHEIRNPLNGVINSLRPLKELLPNLDPDLVELLDIALDGASRVDKISALLMQQARAGEGTYAPVDLGENIALAVQMLSHKSNNGPSVENRFPRHGGFRVVGEAGALNQVWVNLIDNAIHAAGPNGHVVVSLSESEGRVCVEVSDDGAGIQAQDLKRLFDPFFTTKAVGMGTGLGLSVVREIVLRHHGDITVRSSPGHGAQFKVLLPTERPAKKLAAAM